MQIVIELSDDTYQDIKEENSIYGISNGLSVRITGKVVGAIQNGTPLPKGHGDLIDRDKVSSKLVSLIRKFYKMFPTERLISNIDRAKINEVQHCIRTISEEAAIIQAYKAESEK